MASPQTSTAPTAQSVCDPTSMIRAFKYDPDQRSSNKTTTRRSLRTISSPRSQIPACTLPASARSEPGPGPPQVLPDAISEDLYILLTGINPGTRTAQTQHAYAHPSNLFWKLLHQSCLTPGRTPLSPSEDQSLPARFRLGLTNIAARPSRLASELSRAERIEGARILVGKIQRYKPEVVCFVGKGVWDSFLAWQNSTRGETDVRKRKRTITPTTDGKANSTARKSRSVPDGSCRNVPFRYGWQVSSTDTYPLLHGEVRRGGDDQMAVRIGATEEWPGARCFVATTTSGLAAGMSFKEKLAVWMELGAWTEARRRQDRLLSIVDPNT